MSDIPKVEFVNREEAEAHAARAVEFMGVAEGKRKESYAADLEACFELQAVADLVGPASNTGVLGVTWTTRPTGTGYQYSLAANCANGPAHTSITTKATTLSECRDPGFLGHAQAALERLVERNGGLATRYRRRRPAGTSDALLAAVIVGDTGAAWVASLAHPGQRLLELVQIADTYGRDGVHEGASLGAHKRFLMFEARARLVREYPTINAAQRMARALRRGEGAETVRRVRVPVAARETLMRRAGLSPEAAQALLSLLLNGDTTMLALKRAVKSLPAIVDDIDADERKAA